jgi:hypothetical protein
MIQMISAIRLFQIPQKRSLDRKPLARLMVGWVMARSEYGLIQFKRTARRNRLSLHSSLSRCLRISKIYTQRTKWGHSESRGAWRVGSFSRSISLTIPDR